MNNLENIHNGKFDPVPNSLNYGVSVLHAHIRFFEALLHLSYRLPLKINQVRGEINKQVMKERKLLLQQRFREKLNLRVDFPSSKGGNTNCGNTARIAFENPDILNNLRIRYSASYQL